MKNFYSFLLVFLLINFAASQRDDRQVGGNTYLVTRYRQLNGGDRCPLVKKISCDKEGVKAICVRNVTRTNLVEACVTNIYIPFGCAVFASAWNSSHGNFTLVQFEDDRNCNLCPTKGYGLHYIENYTVCMETFPLKTAADSRISSTSSESGKKLNTEFERAEEVEFKNLKRKIWTFVGSTLGFAMLLGFFAFVVYI